MDLLNEVKTKMKYKCRICKLKFKAEVLNVVCPRCNRKGVVPYNDHSGGIFLGLALIFLWFFITSSFPRPFLWFFPGFIILGIYSLIELTLLIIRKTSDPKYYVDKMTGEVHYLT